MRTSFKTSASESNQKKEIIYLGKIEASKREGKGRRLCARTRISSRVQQPEKMKENLLETAKSSRVGILRAVSEKTIGRRKI